MRRGGGAAAVLLLAAHGLAAPEHCVDVLRPFDAGVSFTNPLSWLPGAATNDAALYRSSSGLFTWHQLLLSDLGAELTTLVQRNVSVPGVDVRALSKVVNYTLGASSQAGDPAACWEAAETHYGPRVPGHSAAKGVFPGGAHYCSIWPVGKDDRWADGTTMRTVGGFCAPSACSGADAAAAMGQVVGELGALLQPLEDILKHAHPAVKYKPPKLPAADFSGKVVCVDEQDPAYGKPYSPAARAVVALLGVLAAAVVAATAALHVERAAAPGALPARVRAALRLFDAQHNTAELLRARKGPTSFLDCMRFWSIEWVILGHTYQQLARLASENSDRAVSNFDFRAVFIPSAYLGVDTFFFLSGFLACRKLVRDVPTLLQRSKYPAAVTLARAYFLSAALRWLRLVPLLGFVMLFAAHLVSYLGSGPYWVEDHQGCRGGVGWKYNLLFINNAIDRGEDMCLSWSWYLANDYQFSLVLPFVAMPYALTCGGAGARAGRVFALAAVAALLAVNYWTALDHWMERDAYIRPWHRIAPYAYGMALALVLDSLARRRMPWSLEPDGKVGDDGEDAPLVFPQLSVNAEAAGRPAAEASPSNSSSPPQHHHDVTQQTNTTWSPPPPTDTLPSEPTDAGEAAFRLPLVRWACYAASAGFLFTPFYLAWRMAYDDARGPYHGQHSVNSKATRWDNAWTRFYWFWYNFSWGLGLGLFCLPLSYGGGGLLGRAMRSAVWAPFAKLTYGTYLIHLLIIHGWMRSQWTRPVFTDFNLLMWWLSVSSLAWVCSYVLWLLVEAPAAGVVAAVFRAAK